MKRFVFLVSISALLLAGCEEELDLTADWKDIPIVYGVLNVSDTAHYIRVEKAFLDDNGSAFLAADNPDSIYYQDITVTLTNLNTGFQRVLERVDGTLEGYPRDTGIFAQLPNYLYKVNAVDFPILGTEEVRLSLNRGDILPVVTAEAVILDEIIPLGGLGPGSKVDFNPNTETNFRWRAGEEARVFDLKLLIHIEELDNITGITTEKVLEWTMARGVDPIPGSFSNLAGVFGLDFYKFLDANLEANQNVDRLLTQMDLVIIGGGEAIERYISIALANTGITSSQEVPVYTNLSEGRGIFSSVSEVVVEGLLLTNESINTLKTSEFTADLNFI